MNNKLNIETMNTTLIQIAILEDKIWNETATMDEEVLYHNLVQEIEDQLA